MTSQNQFTDLDDRLLVRAPAKINLCLLVAGKRPDGYHELKTIMAKVNWYDELIFEKAQSEKLELVCTGPHWAPAGEDNLVYRACSMLLKEQNIEPALKVTLRKNIPVGTGLGSASSDAAAALVGLNKFLNLDISNCELSLLAAKLGSDVPFFLDGPLAFCTGKGEKITKIAEKFDFCAILIVPNITVSTKKVYENYKHNPHLYSRLDAEINGLLGKNRIDLIPRLCANMLSESCFQLHRQLAEIKTAIEQLGLKPMCLSGSGSAMFCLLDEHQKSQTKQYQLMLKESIGCEGVILNNNRW